MSKKYKTDPELVISKLYNEVIFSWRGDRYLDIDIFPQSNIHPYNGNSYGICLLDDDLDSLIRFLIKHRLK